MVERLGLDKFDGRKTAEGKEVNTLRADGDGSKSLLDREYTLAYSICAKALLKLGFIFRSGDEPTW